MPKRIQRKRTKGWRMPPGAVYVGRPTKWGNPFKVRSYISRDMAIEMFRKRAETLIEHGDYPIEELRGKDLACWCALDQPCHADVLLELANEGDDA